ncbi:MAG TPA: TetR/AcrR family transcriptional regulator [Ramlibacter sp.]|nr:TetR/AcrR family transcriptional regulator [Ramlibacter sp.]
MESPPSRKQLTHERIVETAARAIRSGGFSGVGVADIMKQAGLTHGGFYAHFASRDALLAEALQHTGRESQERIARSAQKRQASGVTPLRALVEGYLSEAHLASTESGCPVAALASEMPRQAESVREAAAQRVRSLLATVGRTLPADTPAATATATATAIASQLVGALQLARALGDNAEGKAVLAASRKSLLAQYDTPSPKA